MGRDLAEDLAQDVLLVIEQKYARVEAIEELLPLSLQIVRFKMAATRRKSLRRGEYSQVSVEDVPLPSAGESPEAYAIRKEREERLAAAMSRLEGRCREMFRLKLEGMSFAEIQSELKAATINTIYTWDFRCRKQLLELLGGRWERES